MATQTRNRVLERPLNVVLRPRSPAEAAYRSAVLAPGFEPEPGLDLRNFDGRTIARLAFTNVYLGRWDPAERGQLDRALAAAMADPHLNNVIAQYSADDKATSKFEPSRFLDGPVPHRVFRDTVETLVAGLAADGSLAGLDLNRTVVNLMLPRGTVLVDGTSTGRARRADDDDGDAVVVNPALAERDEAVDSKHGLGGYHGSIHPRHGATSETVCYAVGVYSEGSNGIAAFDEPWKSVCATFYHELCEARTDPDVEDAIRAGNDPAATRFLGWYSPHGGEIGDIPMEEAGSNLGAVMQEVPVHGGGTAPIQLMWSNAVAGPEGPIAHKHPAAKRG